ncbi:MAG TPA: PKD domain-containing protein [Propionicimonas sp.]
MTLTAADFQRLPLTPSGPSYQPADGRGLVNMPLIVFTDASVQQLQTVVLGVPVTVRATPVSFAWDFGDGSNPLVTTDPGAPYPHQTVTHTYVTAGSYSVSLSTTWRGEFQVNGQGPWLPVVGTARTTSTPFVETVEAAPSHLVAEPLPTP